MHHNQKITSRFTNNGAFHVLFNHFDIINKFAKKIVAIRDFPLICSTFNNWALFDWKIIIKIMIKDHFFFSKKQTFFSDLDKKNIAFHVQNNLIYYILNNQ